METADINKTIVYYLVENCERLKGVMPSPRYFFVVRGSTGEPTCLISGRHSIIAHGTAVDVLADVIENSKFFGEGVSESPNQATNINNSKLVPLKAGDKIYGEFTIKSLENGLLVAAERINPKGYLDILRTPQGFKQSAYLLGVNSENEKYALDVIVSILYASE